MFLYEILLFIVLTKSVKCQDSLLSYADLKEDILSRKDVRFKVPPGGGIASVPVSVDLAPFAVLDIDDGQQVSSGLVVCLSVCR